MGQAHNQDMVDDLVIPLSSGEAELCALVTGAARTIGLAPMVGDLDFQVNCTVCTDVAAVMGMVH